MGMWGLRLLWKWQNHRVKSNFSTQILVLDKDLSPSVSPRSQAGQLQEYGHLNTDIQMVTYLVSCMGTQRNMPYIWIPGLPFIFDLIDPSKLHQPLTL